MSDDDQDLVEETQVTLTWGVLLELLLLAQERGYDRGREDQAGTTGGPLFPGWTFRPSCPCQHPKTTTDTSEGTAPTE